MIEAFELGVALTLETDAARTALNGVGQQLSTLDRDMAAFEKRMTEMPEALARLSIPQPPSGNERSTGQGEHLGPSSPPPSLAPHDQGHLQSIANLLDYRAITRAFGGSPQGQESAHDENARAIFRNGSGSDGNPMAPAATDILGAMSPSMSDMVLQATELAREAASRADTVSFPHETAGSTHSLVRIEVPQPALAVQAAGREEFQNPVSVVMAEHGDSPSSALSGRAEPASSSLRELLGAFVDQGLPNAALQLRGTQFATDIPSPESEVLGGNWQTGRESDTASWGVPTAAPSVLTSADMVGSFGLSPDSRMNSGLILPGEMEADSAGRGVAGSAPSWANSAVPPTFPYPTLPQDSLREAYDSSENQRRNSTRYEDQSDGENMSNPLVIHTNLHIDGEVVARVVSEKMVAWMNGPLAGTGGFDGRRSYTPVES